MGHREESLGRLANSSSVWGNDREIGSCRDANGNSTAVVLYHHWNIPRSSQKPSHYLGSPSLHCILLYLPADVRWFFFACHRFGLKTTFIDEGTFKARVLANDEEFPIPDKIDFSSVPVPVS